MRLKQTLILLLFAGLFAPSLAASGPPSPTQAEAAPNAGNRTPNASDVAPQAPVVTISGLCERPTASPCTTVITRSQFEEFTKAMDPNMQPRAQRQFAASYARALLFARVAEKQGLDKDPGFQKLLELMRLELLGQTLLQKAQEKSQQATREEIEKFYRENPKPFEVATVLRIFVPKAKLPETGDSSGASTPENDASMQEVAEKLRARAAAGEDFGALQKEAFLSANMKAPPPDTNLGRITRDRLARDHQVVFDLKPGDVSAVFAGTDAYYVYKLVSKELPPLDAVRNQVQKNLQSQRLETWMNGIVGSAKIEFDEKYFGGAAPNESPGPPPN